MPARPALEVATAVGHSMRLVLGQHEVTAAIALLQRMPLRGRVVVADAGLLCRPVVEAIRADGGEYLEVVKGNQPQLHDALATWAESQVSPPGPGAARR